MKQLKNIKCIVVLIIVSLFLCSNYRDVHATEYQSDECVNLTDNVDLWNVIGHDGATQRQGPSAIFDTLAKTKWCVAVKIGDHIRNVQWAMKEPVTVYEYSLVTSNDAKNRDPWAWTLYGYNSLNEEWMILDVVNESNLPEERGVTTEPFVIDNPGEYQYFKFEITDNRGHLNDLYYQVSDLNLFGKRSINNVDEGSKVQAGSYINLCNIIKLSGLKGDEGENGIEAALDNDVDTKWRTAISETQKESSIQWTMTEAVQLDAYAFVTADDMWKLDPKAWTLYGSDNSRGDWVVLSSVSDGELPKDRKTMSAIFNIDNPGTYKHYKLTITDNRGHMMTKHQFSEIMLLAKEDNESISANQNVEENNQVKSITNYIWMLLLIVVVIVAIRLVLFMIIKNIKNKTKCNCK